MATFKYNKLAGKSVLVIGGSSGIGFGIAEASVESGAKVTISSSSQARVDAAVQKLAAVRPDATVQGFACDLSKTTAEQDIDAVFDKIGDVDHVIYTAADSLSLLMLQDLEPELIQKATQMRMVVPFMVAKVAARRLPKRPESSIVITSGTASHQSSPGWSLVSYLAAGMQGMIRALALEIGPIRINAVAPGFVDTGLWDGLPAEARAALIKKLEDTMPVGRAGSVEDVVEAYLWLMKDRNVTGTVASTNSGQFVICPW